MEIKKYMCVLLAMILILTFGLAAVIYVDEYRTAVEWAEEDAFSKATSYPDLPFFTELHDPGFVDYAYAGEMMEMCCYEEAIPLLIPMAGRNYRDFVQMLEMCIEKTD